MKPPYLLTSTILKKVASGSELIGEVEGPPSGQSIAKAQKRKPN